ncbi:MAG TPA: glycosyltransferase family 9 protein [archaeon]|nr:glycosyltransferase family 9 protein [archaeon]
MTRSGKMRILSLNLHGLGDFIMSMPVLSALARNGCESITSMVWPGLESFARLTPFIDTLVPLPKDKENDPALSRFVSELTGPRGFDLVLDFSFMPRAAIITRAATGKRTMGFGIDLSAYPWYTDTVPGKPEEHRLSRNLHFLEQLHLQPPGSPDFPIREPDGLRERVYELVALHGVDLLRDVPIALHPGSGVAKRNWPPERFAGLADMLIDYTGRPVILLGGKERAYDGSDETELAAAVEANMLKKAVNLAGKFSLAELAVLLTSCSLFVGNNSGPGHLAASIARIPVLLVWAPRNEKIWRPVGPNVEVVSAGACCREGCTLNECEKMQYCLSLVSVEDVFGRYLKTFPELGAVSHSVWRSA